MPRPPSLVYERGALRVRFLDWRERCVELVFRGAIAFSWDDGDAAWCAGHRDDASYIVNGSGWLRRHVEVGTIEAASEHRHYKLCFNAAWRLAGDCDGLGSGLTLRFRGPAGLGAELWRSVTGSRRQFLA
jgi:hypothetical protein